MFAVQSLTSSFGFMFSVFLIVFGLNPACFEINGGLNLFHSVSSSMFLIYRYNIIIAREDSWTSSSIRSYLPVKICWCKAALAFKFDQKPEEWG